MRKWVALLLFFLSITPLWAIVYDLAPQRNGRPLLNPFPATEQLWNERMVINGFASDLTLDVSSHSATDLLAELIRLDPKTTYTSTGGNILAISDQGAYEKRYLIICLSNETSTLRFSLLRPKKISSPTWPKGLPRIAGVTLKNSFVFPSRGTAAVEFLIPQSAQFAFESFLDQIEAQNCHTISASHDEDRQGASALLYQNATRSLLGFALSDLPDGGSQGVMVLSPTRGEGNEFH